MASIQKKSDSWYCQFTYQRQRHSLPLGKVEETEAKAAAARVDYILMRIRQRLLAVPAGMDIVTFIEHDGKPPSVTEDAPVRVLFCELRERYLEIVGNGAIEANTLNTTKIHLNHVSETLGAKFEMEHLEHADLQRHIIRRQKDKVAAATIKKEIDTFRAAWNWAFRTGLNARRVSECGPGVSEERGQAAVHDNRRD